jgi:hypothetical protein
MLRPESDKIIVPRVAVLIADSFGEPFESIKTALHPYIWAELRQLGVDIFYIRGNEPRKTDQVLNLFSEKTRYSKFWPVQYLVDQLLMLKYNFQKIEVLTEQDSIVVNVPEGLRTLGIKVRAGYFTLFDLGYDVVFKTTLSSVVNTKKFIETVNGIPLNIPFYGGREIEAGRRTFISGANTMLNRKSINLIRTRRMRWNNGKLDDVALGRILKDISRTKIQSLNIESMDSLQLQSTEDLAHALHFRCKSSKIERDDIALIKALLVRLSANED